MDSERQYGPVSLTVLTVIAVIAALYFGSEILVPIGFAVVLSVAFAPVVRALKRLRIPPAIGGAIVVLGVVGALGTGVWLLERPIKGWIEQAPARLEAVQGKFEKFRRPVEKVSTIANRVGQGMTGGGPARPATTQTTQPAASPSSPPAPANPEQTAAAEEATQRKSEVGPARPGGAPAEGAVAGVLGTTRKLLSAAVEVILLLYLLLATDELLARKVIKVTPRFQDKEKAARAAREIERVVLQYLWVTLLINIGQGTVVGLVMWWLGMPAPLLWGAATLVLEFVPYLGATVMVALLTVTAAATFDPVGRILAPPLAYLVITTIQNNVVSPYLYGSHLKLNPVAVLVGVLFWWFVWGVPGAFLAVPIVATTKIVADRVEHWKPLGEFLGE